MESTFTSLTPVIFVSHGGGPCFWIDWSPSNLFDGLRTFFEKLPETLSQRPSAIIVISAHWEESAFKIQSCQSPKMIFDYYGFPEHTYRLNYPTPGSPELAQQVADLFKAHSIDYELDFDRGFDHGVYVPLLISYPKADIPVLQISLRSDLSPTAHFEVGIALAELRKKNVLIVGSGFSYHNLSAIPDTHGVSQEFDRWLYEAVVLSTPLERSQKLKFWESAPKARKAHPREEHLIPLLVCAGAAQSDLCQRTFSENLTGWNVQTSCFKFG